MISGKQRQLAGIGWKSRGQARASWLSALSLLVLAMSIWLTVHFDHQQNAIEFMGFWKALCGTALLAITLALIRPAGGVYHGFWARCLWGFSLAHYFILFMCAVALGGLVTDLRIVGRIAGFSVFGAYYSILLWVGCVIFAIFDSRLGANTEWTPATNNTMAIALSPVAHLTLYTIVFFGHLTEAQHYLAELAKIPRHFVFLDTRTFVYTAITFSLLSLIILASTRASLNKAQLLKLADLFILLHALFSFTKYITLLFALNDPSLIAPVMGEALSGYTVAFLIYFLLRAMSIRLTLNLPDKRSLLFAVACLAGAFFIFAGIAPVNLLALALIPLGLLVTVLAYLSSLEGTIRDRTEELATEKARSEALLANILPQHVVQELKDQGASSPRIFDDVSVMFTDFVGFTEIAQKLTPEQLVAQLNEIFTGFDAIVERHHSERIKTIGDAYMCVSGLTSSDSMPTKNLITAASEMLEFVEQFNKSSNTSWQIRIGIASGSCVAGIVGTKKYQFDLFGDTVNTAARMEAYSSPGLINIDQQSYELAQYETGLVFEARPVTHVKGKGDQNMYFVASA